MMTGNIFPDMENLTHWIAELPVFWIYIFLIVSYLLENVFPPWPSDVISIFSGFLAARGVLRFEWTLISAILGNFLGSFTMYYTGSKILAFLDAWKERRGGNLPGFLEFASRERLDQSRAKLNRYGLWLVFFSRFLAGIRFFVSIAAGMIQMNLTLYTFAFAGGVILWSGLLISGGYILGENWEDVITIISYYNKTFLALLFIGLIVYAIVKYRRRSRKSSAK